MAMTFDGSFDDMKQKILSESSIQAIYPELVRIQDFAHDYGRDLDGRPGETVVIPDLGGLSAAAEFDEETNNYFSSANEISARNVTLDTHLIKGQSITDRQLMATGIDWLKDVGEAIGSVLGRAANQHVFEMLNDTNCPISAECTLGTKAQVANLYAVAADNGLDVHDSVVVLCPTEYAKVLGVMDYMTYGKDSAIVNARLPGVAGFRSFVCSTYLPEGTKGAIINRSAIGVASRYIEPGIGYPATWRTVEPSTGLSYGWRLATNLATGRRHVSAELLFASKVLLPNKIVRLV